MGNNRHITHHAQNTIRRGSCSLWRVLMVVAAAIFFVQIDAEAQTLRRGKSQMVTGGVLIERLDSLEQARADSIANVPEHLKRLSEKQAKHISDSLARMARRKARAQELGRLDEDGNIIPREKWFGDSLSLSRMTIASAILPGYGQIYNKQYWKLPILYGTLGTSIGLAAHFGNRHKPLKQELETMFENGLSRTEEMNLLQRQKIRENTKKQLFMFTAAASYIYFIGDAAMNYATNDVSDVKKATTLSLIFPGAGQAYNKRYWKVPIVLGGMASMIYVIDWNNRGFKRFKTAYALRADFDQHPENYPGGISKDEFNGRYSATFLKNLRDSYRRNRDLSILLTAGVYIFQAVDAHVDAHLKDFDISDDLTVDLDPMLDYQYTQIDKANPIFGFNLNLTF